MTKKVLIADNEEEVSRSIVGLLDVGLSLRGINEKIEYLFGNSNGDHFDLAITNNVEIMDDSRKRNIPTIFYGSIEYRNKSFEMGANWIGKSFFLSPVYLILDSMGILFGEN